MVLSSPRERVMVKYKVKDGIKGERVEVMSTNDADEALKKNLVETEEVIVKGTNKEHKSGDNEYKEKAKILMGEIKKAARSGDL